MNFADFFGIFFATAIILTYSCISFRLETKKVKVKKTK